MRRRYYRSASSLQRLVLFEEGNPVPPVHLSRSGCDDREDRAPTWEELVTEGRACIGRAGVEPRQCHCGRRGDFCLLLCWGPLFARPPGLQGVCVCVCVCACVCESQEAPFGSCLCVCVCVCVCVQGVCVRVCVSLRKHLWARACSLPGRSYLLCHIPSLTRCPSWYQSGNEPQVSWPLRGAEASLRGASCAQLTAESTAQCPPGPTPAALTVRGVSRDLHWVGMRGISELTPQGRGMETGDFPGGPVVRNLPPSAGAMGSISAPGRSHMPRGHSAHALQPLSPGAWKPLK